MSSALPSAKFGFNTPFYEQLEFFRKKVNLPTERWDDIKKAAHDRAFIVAGAMKADLLDDLREAMDKAIELGTGLEEFRKDFAGIVQKHGWTGWTGEGSKGGEAWRTKVIYQTNMATSYAAGRFKQLTDPAYLKLRPYWRYVHDDSVMHPRWWHADWGRQRLTLRHDHPFWKTHFPPNGWGCHCYVVPVDTPNEGDSTEPPKDWDVRDSKGNLPGIDKGFDYAPGASVDRSLQNLIDQKLIKLTPAISNALKLDTTLVLEDFGRFFAGKSSAAEFPIAELSADDMALIGAETATVWLSRQSLDDHLAIHPEIVLDDYLKVPTIVENGQVWMLPSSPERLIFMQLGEVVYRAVVKRTADGNRNYLLTLFRNTKTKPPKGAVRIK